jgi:hypothetical protein
VILISAASIDDHRNSRDDLPDARNQFRCPFE